MVATGTIAEQRLILHGISWETYERLLTEHAASSTPRFTFDHGELEIMSPLPEHERASWAIEKVIEIVAEERGIQFANLGSTTFRREDLQRGFEPDACFYVTHERDVRDKDRIDLTTDPPPDLVIEIDMSRSSLHKRPIFLSLGIPEVWRYDGEQVSILLLQGNEYIDAGESHEIVDVTATDVLNLLEARKGREPLDWIRHVRAWAGVST